MAKKKRFTVIGAGNGGKAMAAHLSLKGFPVNLYNRTFSRISAIAELGGIHLESYEGGPHGFGKMEVVTSDIGEAIEDASVIMVVVPSSAHAGIARRIASHLKDGQIIILHPGRTGGAIEFSKMLKDSEISAEVMIAEAETFIYASRSEGPAEARIFRVKHAVPLAALPAIDTPAVLEALKDAYPEFVDGIDVLHTGLNNMGAIFHPALVILNMGRIESTKGDFQFYIDGVTPSTARILEVLDRERVTVAASMNVRARTALEWLRLAYNVHGENLYEAIQNQTGYFGILAPNTLKHRYIFEDIPMSLVPIASLGKHFGVSTRGIESIIRLAVILDGTDYWIRGRTIKKLGIERMTVYELQRYVKTGVRSGH